MALSFGVRAPKGQTDMAWVTYDCACGCHPNARYRRGAAEAAHEHCCCGIVHFVGPEALGALRSYLEERRARGEDADVGPYAVHETRVTAPWGGDLPVAYGLPAHLRAH
ncbi:MAG: hypothetical protein HY330_02490 [Chloroflexi bacterium]|nr:hypothetical protein [Chloroflexota bacterium]